MNFEGTPALYWLIAALALGIAELAAPGVFLIFLALAAAITGALVLAIPELPVTGQLISFVVWSSLAVAIGRRWYRDFPVESADPLLNDRSARLIGEIVRVTEAIEAGSGRVRVGDGEWPARGSVAGVGARMRVVGVDSGVLTVEPVSD
jgi:hypothetical protein